MELRAVIAEVETWPAEARLRLIEEVWDGLARDGLGIGISPEIRGLLDRRLAELEANPDDVVSCEEIQAHASRAR
jgi:putative addiction module component (TIGR02574 family)